MVSQSSPGGLRVDQPPGRPRDLAFGEFSFDPNSRLLRRRGVELPLPPRVLGVLELLLERAGDVVPRQELIDRVWKDAFVTDTSLAEAISFLRQTLGDDSQNPAYIQTVHRRGYRFVSPVTIDSAARDRGPSPPALDDTAPDRISPSIRGELIPWSAAVLCAAVAIAAVWQLTRTRELAVPTPARFTVSPSPGTVYDDAAPALAVSASTRLIAWSACDGGVCRLYMRRLNALEARPIPGTEGAHAPFFSTDGEWIAFFADGRLKKVAIAGGEPVTLADAPEPLGGTWNGRDIIFAASTSGLVRVSEHGGTPEPLTFPAHARGEVRHAWPSVVPGGGVLLFTIETARDGEAGDLGALRLEGDQSNWRTLISGIGVAKAAASDLVVFSRGADLQAVPFDPVRVALAGEPRTLVSNVATSAGRTHFALSAAGDLLFVQPATPDAPLLSWWTPSGASQVKADTRRLRHARLAPDSRRIAAVSTGDSRPDIWVADVERGAATRLTHERINASPVWAADGRVVYFAARDDGPFEVWSRDADAATPQTRLLRLASHAFPGSASPDGFRLAAVVATPQRGTDIVLIPLGGGGPTPLVQSAFDDDAPAFSPDGRLLAYQSAETGRWQVYVVRLGDGRRIPVSTAGGERPVWSRDGAWLYYCTEAGLMRAAVSQNPDGPQVGRVEPIPAGINARIAGIAADGRILLDPQSAGGATRAVMALGWVREARQLIGPPTAQLPR
jgi:serine/threonine-protein kinase